MGNDYRSREQKRLPKADGAPVLDMFLLMPDDRGRVKLCYIQNDALPLFHGLAFLALYVVIYGGNAFMKPDD